MIGATFKSLFRALVDELENATARCKAAVHDASGGLDDLISDLEDSSEDAETSVEERTEKGVSTLSAVIVARSDIDLARSEYDDMAGMIEAAFKSFDWETHKAIKEFTTALVREDVS